MRHPDFRRTVILLSAVLLPSVTLVGIAVRLLRQERELAERRIVQARRTAVAALGQRAQLVLDGIRPDALPDSFVVITTAVRGGRFALPWEATQRTISPDVAGLLRDGGAAEFRGHLTLAGSLYQRAERLARDSVDRAFALLARARTTAARGDSSEARSLFNQLLQLPLTLQDDEGMPFALYAADWLRSHGASPRLHATTVLAPHALYALRTHLQGPDSLDNERRLEEAEQLVALRRDYAALLASNLQQGGRAWLLYGGVPWFVRADSGHIIAARSAPLLNGTRAQLRRAASQDSEPLGPAFPGVYAVLPPPALSNEARSVSRQLLMIVIALTVGLGVISAGIAMRDVQRDVRAAHLRTQFVSSVSHELKTPLTAVRMYAELLRMGEFDVHKRDEYLETIVRESERLTRLLNNVLDFSRIERGEKNYHRLPLSLGSLASDIERSMSYPLAEAGFTLRVNVADQALTVDADRDALAQAVLNLLSNAMKFSSGARDIELNIAARDGRAVIQVSDRGRGITAAARPHIFEKFYRSPDVEREGIPGTGLGLALVAHVASGHGGHVVVDSVEGKGSTFAIHLPLGRA